MPTQTQKVHTINEKIERFFWKLEEELMKKHGFTWIGDESYEYCNDRIAWVEESFEKEDENGKYVDIAIKVLLDEDCNPREVKDIDIDDDNLIDEELYNKIIELYKKFFKNKNNSR